MANLVQHGLLRAGMKDVTTLAVQPAAGRRLILRHGPSLHRVNVHPVEGHPGTPDEEPGWVPLLVASAFDEATVQRLTEAGLSFLDERGNTYLVLDERTVVFARAAEQGPTTVRVAEEKPPRAHRATGALALNRAGHRVAFALLADPTLAGTSVRALAATAKVSVGTVHGTLAQLTEAGFLLDGELHSTGRLLDTWTEAYRRLTIRPLTPRPLYAPDQHWPTRLQVEPAGGVLVGGFAAGAILDDEFRATDGIVYTKTLGPAVTLLRLSSAPTSYRVDVRERFWGGTLPASKAGLVPSVLIYGDLLRDGDSRSITLAAHLRKHDAHLRALG